MTTPDNSLQMQAIYWPNQQAIAADSSLAKYALHQETVSIYESLPTIVGPMYDSCGKGSKTDPPTMASVVQVPPIQSNDTQFFANYSNSASQLVSAFEKLQEADVNIVKVTENSANISATTQAGFNTNILTQNQKATTVSANSKVSQDDYTLTYIENFINNLTKMLTDAYNANTKNAAGASGPTSTATSVQQQIDAAKTAQQKADQQQYNDLQTKYNDLMNEMNGASGPASVDFGASGPADAGNYQSLFGASGASDGADGLGDAPGVTGASDASLDDGSDSDIGSQLQNAIDSLQNSGDANSATQASDPYSSMMDSGMLPMMLDSMMNRGNSDSDLDDRRNQLDPANAIQATPPQPVASTPGAVQASQPTPPAPTTDHSQPGGATGPTSSQPTLSQPAQNPDGTLTYTFEDGRTQQVTMLQKQVLDAARANTDGTDAKAAYANTAAKWSDVKHIDPVDPSQVMTCDVATWDGNRTAVVVAFPPDQANATGSLEVYVQGKLQKLPPDMSMSDKQGDFGQFTGFAHPPSLQAAAASGPSGAAIAPDMPDHSAVAAAVTAPTS